MSIVVTGATGQLGRLTVESLLARGVPPEQIVAAGRNADRLAELADKGVRTARIDFADPTTLKEAFAGADALLLVALSEETLRWGELRRRVEGISEKMLAQTLRVLEADGFVHREAQPTIPPHVEYSLTDRGREIAALLIPLMHWIVRHAAEIVVTSD